MKFGIISFAHMHAHAYAHVLKTTAGVELVGIADDDVDRGAAAAKQYETAHYVDYRDLLEQPLDAVIICSPNAMHRKHAVAAAAAGKHVLCEKPIAVTMADAQAMITAAEEAGILLRTAFPMRHSLPVQQLKSTIAAGTIGDVISVSSTNRGKVPPGWFVDRSLAGGGAVMDHTVHVADLLRWIFDTEIARVYAEVDALFHDVEIDDCGVLVMDLASGAIASLDPSWSRPHSFPTWGDVTMEVVGTRGVVSLDAFNQKGMVWLGDVRSGARNDATPGTHGAAMHHYWGNDPDRAMIRSFVAALRDGDEVGATGWDGLKATETALAAYASARRNEVVELPLP